MTAYESTTMHEDVATEHERLAAEAFERIRTGQHWRDWTLVAAGLNAGRDRAMREAGTNQAMGRRYNEAMGRWMDRNPWSRKIDKATRNHLLWVADHLAQIEAWRETLAANQRDKLNHPTTIKRQYENAMRVAELAKAGAPAKLSPVAQYKEALAASQEEVEIWKKRALSAAPIATEPASAVTHSPAWIAPPESSPCPGSTDFWIADVVKWVTAYKTAGRLKRGDIANLATLLAGTVDCTILGNERYRELSNKAAKLQQAQEKDWLDEGWETTSEPAAAPEPPRAARKAIDKATADYAALGEAIKAALAGGMTEKELLFQAQIGARKGYPISAGHIVDLAEGRNGPGNYHIRDTIWAALGGRPAAT